MKTPTEAEEHQQRLKFDKQTQTKLDHTPNSLLVVEEILLSKFENKQQLRQDENFDFVNGWVLYIGDVFVKNDKIRNLEWISHDDTNTLPSLECLSHANSVVNIKIKLPIILHKRSGDVIYNYFIKNTEYFKENHAYEARKPSKVHPSKGGFSYQYFILIKDESFDLNEIEQALKAYYIKKGKDKVQFHNEGHLLVHMEDNYYFHFQIDTSEGVLQESKEIAENYTGDKDKSVIAPCKRRVEFWGDEDPNGNYINDHMYLLEQLLQNDKLMIFDFRNGIFFDEF